MKKQTIAFSSDHAGYDLKRTLNEYILSLGYKTKDLGAFSAESSDYPDFAHSMAKVVESGECEIGISICGTGNGVNMVANKYSGIRSALCWNAEIAKLARSHNDANVLALPARFIRIEEAFDIVKVFLETPFEGGRHKRRVDKISVK